MNYYVKFLIGFIVLDLFLNGVIAKSSQLWLQVLFIVVFFLILKGILIFTKVKEFKRIGIHFHKKWLRNMMLGFLIGFSFWLLKYAAQFLLHGFVILEMNLSIQTIIPLLMIIVTFFVASFLNDLVVRGYVFGHLKEKIPMKWVFFISLLIYAFDDVWNEGFSLSNTLFSLVLGLALTYAIYKTGSIWLTTGIHWGLNVCYGLFNGSVGNSGNGIFVTEFHHATIINESITYLVALFMFLFSFWILGRFEKRDKVN